MMARLETGEVLLTTSIAEVFVQFLFAIVAWNVTLAQEVCKLVAVHSGEFSGFAEREYTLRIQRYGQLEPQPCFNLFFRQAQAPHYGFRDAQVDGHCFSLPQPPAAMFESEGDHERPPSVELALTTIRQWRIIESSGADRNVHLYEADHGVAQR